MSELSRALKRLRDLCRVHARTLGEIATRGEGGVQGIGTVGYYLAARSQGIFMKSDQRPKVRPVQQTSIADKVFAPVGLGRKQIALTRVHPLVVLADMRRGSLVSLERYLIQEGGISDPAIALELQKLIAGGRTGSKFKLLVVESTAVLKRKVGRKSAAGRAPTPAELDLATRYEAVEENGIAAALVEAAAGKSSTSHVRQVVKRVRKHRADIAAAEAKAAARESALKEGQDRKAQALQTLRDRKPV